MLLVLGLGWLLDGTALAQKAPEHDHLIRFASAISPVQEKFIHEVLKGVEPDMQVWVDLPNAQVKVRSHVPMRREELQTAWNAVGLVIIYCAPIIAQHMEERAAEQPATIPGAVEGQADPPGYQETKAAWILAHPKEYEQLSDPLAPH